MIEGRVHQTPEQHYETGVIISLLRAELDDNPASREFIERCATRIARTVDLARDILSNDIIPFLALTAAQPGIWVASAPVGTIVDLAMRLGPDELKGLALSYDEPFFETPAEYLNCYEQTRNSLQEFGVELNEEIWPSISRIELADTKGYKGCTSSSSNSASSSNSSGSSASYSSSSSSSSGGGEGGTLEPQLCVFIFAFLHMVVCSGTERSEFVWDATIMMVALAGFLIKQFFGGWSSILYYAGTGGFLMFSFIQPMKIQTEYMVFWIAFASLLFGLSGSSPKQKNSIERVTKEENLYE